MTIPSLYSEVNLEKPRSYSDYDSVQFQWGSIQQYEITRKLGRGKYSEVFQGVNLMNSQPVAIKILKPVHKRKIKREIKILQTLQGNPQVPRLLDIVRDRASRTPSLILEYCHNIDFKAFYAKLTDFEARFYSYELLKVLDYTHSYGIIHRDVKPSNVTIDHQNRQLKLIDWGLAEFYFPDTALSVRVASRYYKAPELLVSNQFYHYSLDIWSAGAILAGIIFKKEPFFHGQDNLDMIIKIARVLGSEGLTEYLEKENLEVAHQLEGMVGYLPKKDWNKFVNSENSDLAGPQAVDLVSQLLVYDHSERLMAREAMKHEYFAPVREMWEQVSLGKNSLPVESEAFETAEVILNNSWLQAGV